MPGVARVHRNSRRAQSGAGAAAGPAKAHRTRPPDRAQPAPRTPPPKDAAVKTGPHFSENIRLTLMARCPYLRVVEIWLAFPLHRAPIVRRSGNRRMIVKAAAAVAGLMARCAKRAAA